MRQCGIGQATGNRLVESGKPVKLLSCGEQVGWGAGPVNGSQRWWVYGYGVTMKNKRVRCGVSEDRMASAPQSQVGQESNDAIFWSVLGI